MPNWTTNIVRISGTPEQITAVKDFLSSKDNVFDFRKILPMPKALMLVDGSITDIAIKYALAAEGSKERENLAKSVKFPYDCGKGYTIQVLNSEEDLAALGRKYLDNKRLYGAKTWYDWCCDNWGTKWNASDDEIVAESEDGISVEYQFQTAWSEPSPVYVALSRQFPDLEIRTEAEYEDEPWNHQCSVFKGGEETERYNDVDEDMRAEYYADEERDD